jgi:hypothetical protein
VPFHTPHKTFTFIPKLKSRKKTLSEFEPTLLKDQESQVFNFEIIAIPIPSRKKALIPNHASEVPKTPKEKAKPKAQGKVGIIQ